MSKTHKNAILSVTGRKALVDSVLIDKLTKVAVAKKFNISVTTVRKWVKRFVSEGESGLEDCSSRPHTSPRATSPETVEKIIKMREEGKFTYDQIARELNMHKRTVSRLLVGANLSQQNDVESMKTKTSTL